LFQPAGQFDPAHPRHADIQQQQIRVVLLHQAKGLFAIGGLPAIAAGSQALQQAQQPLPRQRLIVDYQYLHAAACNGYCNSTLKRSPAASIRNWPREPNNTCRRWRMFSSAMW